MCTELKILNPGVIDENGLCFLSERMCTCVKCLCQVEADLHTYHHYKLPSPGWRIVVGSVETLDTEDFK